MKISVVVKSITDFKGDAIILNIFEGTKSPGGATGAVDKLLGGLISRLIADREVKGRVGEVTVLHECPKLTVRKVILVGLGKKKDLNNEIVRRAAGIAVKKAREINARRVGTIVHGSDIGSLDPARATQSLVEGTCLALYDFNAYRKPANGQRINEFIIVEKDPSKAKKLSNAVVIGQTLADAQNAARDLINEPANILTPEKMQKRIQMLIENWGIQKVVKCQCLDRAALRKMGMGALLAVGQGSSHVPRFIVLRMTNADKPLVGLIGKTVTFDSGGLSIKQSSGMGAMKTDMAGGAVVTGVTLALAKLDSKVNLLTIIPAVENMPSGSAYRPGDVIRAMNGKTIEIVNTDAEGRLTLADSLVYAESKKAEIIIDIATLTGGCVVALGEKIAGLMGNDRALSDKLIEVSELAGEKFWTLPLYEGYLNKLKSDVADLKNSGGRYASAITAGLFLKAFVEKAKWLHIDVAGTELTDKESDYTPAGATGFGVRTIYEFLSTL
ncbi:MAG: leucyl aminopeptidase [candidate division WOR-3 bacterium]|nr:MAG: leucyl aminopeptidase [candidate division WOR-3 bacterium]